MSINFFTQSGNPFAHLQAVTTAVPASAFVGRWSTLELQPDLFVPQCFSVGTVVQAEKQRLHYHLLSDFKKFECIYGGQQPKKLIAEMLSHAEEVLREAVQQRIALEDVDFGSPNLHLSKPVHTSGESADTIIDRLYRDVIVLEPHTQQRIQRFETLDTPAVRLLVNQVLKSIARDDFERIVLDSKEGVIIHDGDRSHYLDVNLRTTKACGSVVSAVYKTVQSIEMNLLRANLDLATFAKLKNIDDRGVFFMLPERHNLDRGEWDRIENVVGEQKWKLERDGFRVVGLDSVEGLAQEIYDWAKPTL
jgi:hypothetical protein